jgi:hypothetical protein
MYVSPNFKTKKAMIEAWQAGRPMGFYQPAGLGSLPPENGRIAVEGPHYPEPHKWYATVVFENGKVVKIK